MKTIVNYAQKVKEQHALNKTLAPVETDLTDASRSYAIGEQFINDGDLFRAKTPIAQHDALVLNTNYEAADDITTQIKNKTVTTDSVPTEGSTNPVQSNGVFVENRNIYAVMGEMGAKNLLPFDLDEIKAANTEGTWAGNVYTRRNVSFTVNSDYSVDVVADGITNTQASGFFYYSASGAEKFVGKSVTLTGCPISGGSSTYNLQAYRAASVDGSGGTEKDTGSGVTLDWMNNGTGIKAMVAISIGAEVSCNAKFKPMLRYAEDIDSTYQPYAKTNQQLTAENEALTNKLNNEIVTRSELGAKNLLPYDIHKIKAINTAGTWNGNTYTPNNSSLNITLNTDGSITVDGTSASAATATLYIYGSASEADENIFKGMIANGCPSGGATNKYSLAIQGFSTTTPSGGNNYHDIGEGSIVGNDNYVRVYVRIQNNTTVSNLTFKPMIRLASDPDATYQPYAKTNQELTAENQTLTNELDTTYLLAEQKTHSFAVSGDTNAEILQNLAQHMLDFIQGLNDGVVIELLNLTIRGTGTTLIIPQKVLLTNAITDLSFNLFAMAGGSGTTYLYTGTVWASTLSANKLSVCTLQDNQTPVTTNYDFTNATSFNFEMKHWKVVDLS